MAGSSFNSITALPGLTHQDYYKSKAIHCYTNAPISTITAATRACCKPASSNQAVPMLGIKVKESSQASTYVNASKYDSCHDVRRDNWTSKIAKIKIGDSFMYASFRQFRYKPYQVSMYEIYEIKRPKYRIIKRLAFFFLASLEGTGKELHSMNAAAATKFRKVSMARIYVRGVHDRHLVNSIKQENFISQYNTHLSTTGVKLEVEKGNKLHALHMANSERILAKDSYQGWSSREHQRNRLNRLVRKENVVETQITGIKEYLLKTMSRSTKTVNTQVIKANDQINNKTLNFETTYDCPTGAEDHQREAECHKSQYVNPFQGDILIHRSRCVRATSVNVNTRHLNKNNHTLKFFCVVNSIAMDKVEEYDPEFPQGRPTKAIATNKLPFTGYFDPTTQSYVIDNFDPNIMSADKANNSQIVVTAPMPQARPSHVAPPNTQDSSRVKEIREYFARASQANAQKGVDGIAGIVPWFRQPQQIPHAGYNTARPISRDPRQKPTGLPLPTVGDPWLMAGIKPQSSPLATPPVGRQPATARICPSQKFTIRQPIASTTKPIVSPTTRKTAKSAVPVDPVALAQIPIHRPSMERISRQEQLRKSPLLGQFFKSTGNKKPKGSKNLPLAVKAAAALTSVPAECWPSQNQAGPQNRMWTVDQVKPVPRSTGLAPPLYMLALPDLTRFRHDIRPVSPLPASPCRKESANKLPSEGKCNKEVKTSTPTVHLELSQKQDTLSSGISPLNNLNCSPSSTVTTPSKTASRKRSIMSESEMDLDATFVEGKRAGSAEDAPPAKKANTMKALATSYQARVKDTKAKLLQKKTGSADPVALAEGNVETEMYHEMVEPSTTPVALPSYEKAPVVTLRQLMPKGISTEQDPDDQDNMPLDKEFKSELIEFVVMIKKLEICETPDYSKIEWDLPEAEFFDQIMNEAYADFIESDITRMDAIKWSSVGSQTGVGVFSAVASKLDDVQLFREVIRSKVYAGHMAESFPRQTMLNDYGLSLYAHKGIIAYRAPLLMRMLLRTHHEDFDASCKCEVLKADKFGADFPIARKQNTRIITLIPNREFLDRLYKFPPNYPFGAGLCKRLFITGGSRVNPSDPTAKKIEKRPRFAKKAMERFLRDAHEEIVRKANEEQEVAEQMDKATI